MILVRIVRLRVCSGGSVSSTRLGGRQGFSLRKSLSPTPAEEQKVFQSDRTARTSASWVRAKTPYRSIQTTGPASYIDR